MLYFGRIFMSSSSFPSLSFVYNQLTNFANLENFWSLFDTAFGSSYDDEIVVGLRSQWQSGDFSQFPQIEVVSNGVLGGANGAYASITNKIYLSDQFLNTANQPSLTSVLIEEFGHFIDTQVNTIDSTGDEGAIFAALVRGESLDAFTLQMLKAEDDSAILILDGQIILVEQSVPSPTQDPFLGTLYTQGRYLYDSSGQKIILRGINLPLLDDWNFPQSNKLSELAKTGANAVRIQWYKNYGNASRPAYSVQDLDNILIQSSAKGIIPILGLWDATCQSNANLVNTQLMSWWTSPDVVAVLKKHQQHLIINLANELGFYRWTGNSTTALNSFKTAYKTAITSIRAQGLHAPIMIDAPDCGTSIDAFNAIGQELIDYDPDHNLLLSAHAYWAGYDGMPALNTAIQANLPIVFGEVANKQDEVINGVTQYGYYDLDGSNTNHPPLNNFTYQALLQSLKTNDIGWLSWSWWKDNLSSRQMTSTGNFANLTTFGNDLVNNTTYGLKTTAQLSTIFVTTFNGTNGNDAITGTTGSDAIHSLRGIDTIDGGMGTDLLIVDYSNNTYGGITSSLTSNGSGGFNGYFSAYYTGSSYDRANFSNIERFQVIGTEIADNINTGTGNDMLAGGSGNDTLTGVNSLIANPGKGERDYLNGGNGADRFVLGDVGWIGYDDGLINSPGTDDYAEIVDFNSAENDVIQLQGGLNYLLSVVGADTQLFIDKPDLEPDELIGIIKNQTGLSLTSSYFAYNPSLSLSVTPATVTEDGTANLIYTFTRTGATANPLTVNYTIGGTAINGTDYAIIGTSITFNPGSSTATLSIDPTIDAVIESDETVALTLLPVMEHTILTTTTVTGTITNDDNNTTIESFGNISLVKDGANKLFTQVGSNAAVALNRNGIQLYEGYAGWSFLAAETVNSSNQVLVKNSSLGVRIWSFDSNWNYVSVRGVATDQIAAQETVFGVDADGDSIIGNNPYTTLESAGNTSLIKDGDNKLFTKMGSNTAIALMRSGTQLFEGYSGWSFLAAETINGSNQALVKNSSLGLRIWRFDSNWNWTSVQGIATAQIPTQETVFGIDANGDGSIGNPNSLTLTGTSGNDTLIGGANSDVLTGLGGKDSLTGGLGSDRFGYQVLTDSFLANPDLITDFNATEDLLLVNSARAGFSDTGSVSSLDAVGIGNVLNTINFAVDYAASFTFGSQTFVAINDGTAGFDETTDSIIEVTGLTGTLGLGNFVIA
jgi:mannan endo-1,4-beta-mannosidase